MSIFVDDVDALHADLVKRGAWVRKEPKDYDYGLRDFDVADLDGNMIFFGMESPHSLPDRARPRALINHERAGTRAVRKCMSSPN